jgi:hypothetical protein
MVQATFDKIMFKDMKDFITYHWMISLLATSTSQFAIKISQDPSSIQMIQN